LGDIREDIRAGENNLEKLARQVPGFAGYKEREARRNADKIQRTFLAEELSRERGRLQEIARPLVAQGKLELLAELDRLTGKIEKVADRIRTAAYGYTGFFDPVKIDETHLDRLYEYDLLLLSQVSAISESVLALSAALAGDDATDALKALERNIVSFDQQIGQREKIVMEVK